MPIRFHRLDLNLLVALDALLTEKSIAAAARRLNLSQSATSGILARLREFFADDLLVQVGRKMMPSPLAVDLAGRVRHVLQTVNSTIVTRTEFDPATSCRHFRVSASDFVKAVLLAEVARCLSVDAPNLTLEISDVDEDPAGRLARGELDLLILPEYLLEGDDPQSPLFESHHTCVVWSGNTRVGDTLSFEQFMELGHVVVRFGKKRVPSFEEFFIKRFGHTRRIEIITDDFTSMAQFIHGTQRIATLHSRLAELYADSLELRLIPPPIDIPVLNEAMQWPRYLDGDPGHRWLRDFISKVSSQRNSTRRYTGRPARALTYLRSPERTS